MVQVKEDMKKMEIIYFSNHLNLDFVSQNRIAVKHILGYIVTDAICQMQGEEVY